MNAPTTAAPLPASLRFIERDWLSCNQILFFDGEGEHAHATLVDTGYVKHAELTRALVQRALRREGQSPVPLTLILNTHLHSDHCGGNATLVQEFGARVEVPASDFEAVQRWDEQRLSFAATGQRCARFTADGALHVGQTRRLGGADWQVLGAPGHDPHSLILHCPEHRLLISADALWQQGFGVIFPELAGEPGFGEQAAVLDLIESLEVDWVLPGHGPAFGDVPAALARARSRLAAFACDPARNARNALKVMVKFLLLDLEQHDLDALVQRLAPATVLQDCARWLGKPLPEALAWAVDELVRQGELARDGQIVRNV